MENLQANDATFFMDGRRYLGVFGDFFLGRQLAAAGAKDAFGVGGNAAGDDKPNLAPGAFAVKGRQFFKTLRFGFKTRVHGAHKDPVFQRAKAKVQGR